LEGFNGVDGKRYQFCDKLLDTNGSDHPLIPSPFEARGWPVYGSAAVGRQGGGDRVKEGDVIGLLGNSGQSEIPTCTSTW